MEAGHGRDFGVLSHIEEGQGLWERLWKVENKWRDIRFWYPCTTRQRHSDLQSSSTFKQQNPQKAAFFGSQLHREGTKET